MTSVTVEADGHVLLIGVDRAAEHLRGLLPELLTSDDAAEGVRSFVERREPRFTGR